MEIFYDHDYVSFKAKYDKSDFVAGTEPGAYAFQPHNFDYYLFFSLNPPVTKVHADYLFSRSTLLQL